MSFIATENKGFRMKFENGFTISVQWGTFNYCEKKNLMAEYKNEMQETTWESGNAEIAVFDTDGELLPIGENDAVIGWLTPNEVAKVIAIVAEAASSPTSSLFSPLAHRDEIVRKIKSLPLESP